jgi:hypothetical protein
MYHVESLENDFKHGTPSSFDHDFTHLGLIIIDFLVTKLKGQNSY